MKLQKIIWSEGMKLDPHHFQQADRFTQHYINTKLSYINPNSWGFKDYQFDTSAMAGGSFSLVRCSGIMPDGIMFDMPGNDSFPKSRSFTELFSPTSEKLDVYLAIPMEKTSGSNCQLNDSANNNNNFRFLLQNVDISDYNSGLNPRTIGMVKPNFQYKFGDESLDDYCTIKTAQIIRNADGKFSIDKSYIPPVLSVSASEMLSGYMREILGALISKAKELKTQASIQKPELSMTQVEVMLMLLTVNTFIPLLNYYYLSQNLHPENLYMLLLNLAGQLNTYSISGYRNGELPVYDHTHLSSIFRQVTDEISLMLNIQKVISRRDINVPLRKQADTLYVGQLSPGQIAAQFFIAIQSEMPEKRIINDLPRNIKISSYEEIFAVHGAGIQGVTVEYVPRPPAGIQVNDRAQYFRINKEGRFWEKICTKNNIAFFLASEFKSLQLELVLLMPGN